MATIDQIDKSRVPQHVAIIMDGNGRWAKAQGYDRSVGHKAGVDSLHTTLEAASQIGIKHLTVYTFSTENWNRPKQEIDTLMNLISFAIQHETEGMIKNGVRLRVIGDFDRLPEEARNRLTQCMNDTAKGEKISLNLALSYSSRWEITRMVQEAAQAAAAGTLKPEDIDENYVSSHLTTRDIPDPELLIRTGGEERISNYLLWQIAYSELYFCDTYWPDFSAENLYEAIVDYQQRERRFGKTSAQIQEENK
ncbi:MAG: isoprenyl transferase [Bacteroidales bacterium]|nr:isoprenyl transferase [Bacteroidales bacterium]